MNKVIKDNKPDLIWIGSNKYKINYSPKLLADDGDELYGQIVYSENIINISTNYKIHFQREGLLHEILHGINYWYNSNRLSEKDIIAMAHGLFDLIRQNPGVLNWIKED